jgi:hypothetical protein
LAKSFAVSIVAVLDFRTASAFISAEVYVKALSTRGVGSKAQDAIDRLTCAKAHTMLIAIVNPNLGVIAVPW